MMTTLLRLQDFDTSNSASFLYTLSAAYLDHTEQTGDEDMSGLNDEQHTLTALCYLDSQVQEGGFVQLIASGYGEYIFGNPVADSLRRWRIKPIPKILDKAKALYEAAFLNLAVEVAKGCQCMLFVVEAGHVFIACLFDVVQIGCAECIKK